MLRGSKLSLFNWVTERKSKLALTRLPSKVESVFWKKKDDIIEKNVLMLYPVIVLKSYINQW